MNMVLQAQLQKSNVVLMDVCQAKVERLELRQLSPLGWQGPKHLGHSLPIPRPMSRQVERGQLGNAEAGT